MRLSTAKSFAKDLLWGLPTPVSRVMVEGACATGLLSRAYSAYYKLKSPTRILSGPFEGMNYFPVAAGSSWLPKILGTYERELHAFVEQACARPCDLIVDIGSAEGYYAVGLARRIPGPVIHCFDTDPRANACLIRNARLNGVADRIVPGDFCTPEALGSLLDDAKAPLVICDCEGGEVQLLDPARAPGLARASVIVEIHDYFDSDAIGRQIRERFAGSHDIETVPVLPRHREDMPASTLEHLTIAEVEAAMNEGRPPARGWMILRPKT